MPAERLYQRDSYLREFDATVTRVEGNKVFLDRTAFHPKPVGGLDCDVGFLEVGKEKVKVIEVIEEEGDVAHVVEKPEVFQPGLKVHGVIDWGRRYRIMRAHTALHIISAILYKRYNALITGAFVTYDVSRADFDLSQVEDWRRALEEAVQEANQIASRCIDVVVKWVSREEASKIPGLVKLAEKAPPDVKQLRVVEIPGVDIQADEGPHVKNTCEIGEIVLEKLESKGRRRRRLYYRVKP